MVLFLAAYVGIYGCVHTYVFLKIRRSFELGLPLSFLLALFMALMVAAPILVRLLEHQAQEGAARTLAYVGFTWMGLVFVFFTLSLVFDIYRLLHYLARLAWHSPLTHLIPTPGQFCLIALLLSMAVIAYGYAEALNIRSEHITINTAKLPEGMARFIIVQISDVHLGLIVGQARLARILEKIRMAAPDLLVSTGDLVDGQMDSLGPLAGLIRGLPTPHGKFAVTGNHEFYAGLDRALAFTEKAGFTLLRDQARTIDGMINIVGMDDPARGRYGLPPSSEKALLENLPRDKFTLLLKHQPVVDAASTGLFDLQLSGHVHKGQIFPFSLATRLAYGLPTGLTKLEGGSLLYVSRGAGTWGPPVRFLAPPEVTVIDLVPMQN